MGMTLNKFKDDLAKATFGQTPDEAKASGLCISCGKEALPSCFSEAGRREYQLSGLCEVCFDDITREPEDYNPEDDNEPAF